MPARSTIDIDPHVRERLDALAAQRGMDPADVVAELILEAELAQVVDEVNGELERLAHTPVAHRERQAQTREFEDTVAGWMRV
jgi:hypothetical protein